MTRKALALLAALVVLLTGCVTIPDSGTVHAGEVVEFEGSSDQAFFPSPPAEGATQEEILEGFYRALVSPRDDFAIARLFLTDALADSWNPDAHITVRQSNVEITRSDDTHLEAAVPVLAQIDEQGVLTPGTTEIERMPFTFTLVGDQWRIADAPDGIVLSRDFLLRLFEPTTLAFFSTDGTRIVPDVRWVPSANADRHERIVDLVLAGAAPWLAGGASTAAAPGVQRLGVVAPNGASAVTITVSSVQLGEGHEQLARLAQQVQLSLSGDGIAEATVIVADSLAAGNAMSASSAEAPALAGTSITSDTRAIVLVDGELYFAGASATTPVGAQHDLTELAPQYLTVVGNGDGGIALGAQGLWRLQPDGSSALIDSRTDLLAPSLGPDGDVWLVSRSSPTVVEVYLPDGTRLPLPLPSGGQTVSIELSADGARLAVLTQWADHASLAVFAVERDAEGVPTGLGTAFPVAELEADAARVTWASDTSLAVLERGVDSTIINAYVVGGMAQSIEDPGALVATIVGAAGNSVEGLQALTVDGRLLVWRSNTWQQIADDVQLVATRR